MLDCSTKSALNPADLTEQYVEGLREAGFDDNQIVAIVLVTCLFNFMNCIANSKGVAVRVPSLARWGHGWPARRQQKNGCWEPAHSKSEILTGKGWEKPWGKSPKLPNRRLRLRTLRLTSIHLRHRLTLRKLPRI